MSIRALISSQVHDVTTPTVTPISIDQVVADSAVPGEHFEYTLAATTGDRMFFDLQAGAFTATYRVVAPDDTQLWITDRHDFGAFVADQTGDYSFFVEANSDTSFQFRVWSVPDPITRSVNIDELILDSRDTPGEEDYFTFTGTTGQELYFNVFDNATFYTWQLTDPAATCSSTTAFETRA